jgi:hypothetical protein
MVQNRICRLRCSPRDARRVRLSQGIRRLCCELMLLQKAVLEARGLKPNLFDNQKSEKWRMSSAADQACAIAPWGE